MDMPEYMKASNWIWNPDWSAEDKDRPRVMLFRKKLRLADEPYEGRMKISADTRYKLYVNGRLVEVGPSRGDHQVWFYDTVDIGAFLRKGANVIGVSVLRYPEDPAAGNHGMFRTPLPGLYVTGKIRDMAGYEYDVSADDSWKCRIDIGVTFTGKRNILPRWSSTSVRRATRNCSAGRVYGMMTAAGSGPNRIGKSWFRRP